MRKYGLVFRDIGWFSKGAGSIPCTNGVLVPVKFSA